MQTRRAEVYSLRRYSLIYVNNMWDTCAQMGLSILYCIRNDIMIDDFSNLARRLSIKVFGILFIIVLDTYR